MSDLVIAASKYIGTVVRRVGKSANFPSSPKLKYRAQAGTSHQFRSDMGFASSRTSRGSRSGTTSSFFAINRLLATLASFTHRFPTAGSRFRSMARSSFARKEATQSNLPLSNAFVELGKKQSGTEPTLNLVGNAFQHCGSDPWVEGGAKTANSIS